MLCEQLEQFKFHTNSLQLTNFSPQQLVLIEKLSWTCWSSLRINREVFRDFSGNWRVHQALSFSETIDDISFQQKIFGVANCDVWTFKWIITSDLK